MRFSKCLIQTREPGRKRLHILFATTNYHVFRAELYARKAHVICMAILLGLFAFVQLVIYNDGMARWLITQLGSFVR